MFDELPLSHRWEVEIETPPASYDFISNEETEGRKEEAITLAPPTIPHGGMYASGEHVYTTRCQR